RGAPPSLSISRSAARGSTPEYGAAFSSYLQHPTADDGAGIHGVPDADSHVQLSGGGSGLSRAQPAPSGQVLRLAAGAAAVQAAPDGLRLRSLLPDCTLLSRRGCTGRPLAGRV